MRIGFIGLGNMGLAMARGLIDDGHDIIATARNKDELKKRIGRLNIRIMDSNIDLCENSDMVIICVKPNQVGEILEEVATSLENKIVVSIAVNVFYEDISSSLSMLTTKKIEHISILPNLPIAIRMGTTLCESKHSLSDTSLKLFNEVLGQASKLVYLEAKAFKVAGAISGCGPAIVAVLEDALLDAGIYNGLQKNIALDLINTTIEGSAKLMDVDKLDPSVLKNKITSPGGTTIKGVLALEKNNFRYAVMDSINSILGNE